MAKKSVSRKPVQTAPVQRASRSATEANKQEMDRKSREVAARWTFLTNHSHVLLLLARNPSMVLREVAALVGITERAVQRIIAELEDEGFIQREKVGRQNHYKLLTNKHLRHPIEAHRTINDLIQMINESAR